jgi:hypothetical protein
MGLLQTPSVAIDGSKFKAVNNRDRNFTRAKMARRMAQIEESVGRYLRQLDSADRQEPSEATIIKTTRNKEKIAAETGDEPLGSARRADAQHAGSTDIAHDPDARSMATSGRGSGVVGYNVQVAVDKAGIVVPSKDKLPAVIDTLIAAVRAGELDDLFSRAAKAGPSVRRARQLDHQSAG